MLLPDVNKVLKGIFQDQLNLVVDSSELVPAGGGSINHTFRVKVNGNKNFFLKLNAANDFPGLFEKEKNGLRFLADQDCILTPPVIFCVNDGQYQFLLLEWIERGPRTEDFWKKFGEQLARLHQVSNNHFGFLEDNYMGSLPQRNNLTKNWTGFFIDYRLRPQIALARNKDRLDKTHIVSFDSLFKKLDTIFNPEKPSLLHGDLWNGNFMCNENSDPVLIDPAVYFGHRSMDLAMTTLFGGFDHTFYDAYHYHFPLPGNHREQWEVCNLYPLLIHLNLFGEGYLHDIIYTLRKFS